MNVTYQVYIKNGWDVRRHLREGRKELEEG